MCAISLMEAVSRSEAYAEILAGARHRRPFGGFNGRHDAERCKRVEQLLLAEHLRQVGASYR